MEPTLKRKKHGVNLEMRTFEGNDGVTYLVFRSTGGSYHVFAEVQAKEAARRCGATKGSTPRTLWGELWSRRRR
jgi:hypothetical protein